MSNNEILSTVLKLPVSRREKIAEQILGSIKSPSRRHIETLWAQEANSRVKALLNGKIKTVPAPEVLAYRGAHAR